MTGSRGIARQVARRADVAAAQGAPELFQPAGADEPKQAKKLPPVSRFALATDEDLARRLGGFTRRGTDRLVRDPIGRQVEVWRPHPKDSEFNELIGFEPAAGEGSR